MTSHNLFRILFLFKVLACSLQDSDQDFFFFEEFSQMQHNVWVDSEWTADLENSGEEYLQMKRGMFSFKVPESYVDQLEERGIGTSLDNLLYLTSTKFGEPFSNEGTLLIFQFSYREEQLVECSHLKLKLLPEDFEPFNFGPDQRYLLALGLELCGSLQRIRIDINYKGKILEWQRYVRPFMDSKPHFIRLQLHPSSTYQVLMDNEVVAQGDMINDWDFVGPPYYYSLAPDEKRTNHSLEGFNYPANFDEFEIFSEACRFLEEGPAFANEEDEYLKTFFEDISTQYKATKNRSFAPSQHQNVYRLEKVSGIGIEVFETKTGLLIDNILLTSSLKNANSISEDLLELYSKQK